MPSPENKPEIHASYLEPTAPPAKVKDEGNTVLVNRSESNVLFVRALQGDQSVVSIAISPNNDVHVVFPDGTTIFHPVKKQNELSPLPLQAETQTEPEKEKPVKLRGRIGIGVRVMDSPTGGKMAVTSFAEHPAALYGVIQILLNTNQKKIQSGGRWLHLMTTFPSSQIQQKDKNMILPAIVAPGKKLQKKERQKQ